MTPLRGQNVYSADGTRYVGKVNWVYSRKALGFSVNLSRTQWPAFDADVHVLEWDRALGGWLAL